jgi:hypothetical protein
MSPDSFVMVIDCHRNGAFNLFLTNQIFIQLSVNFFRVRKFSVGLGGYFILHFFQNNLIAKLNAGITDINVRPGDQLPDMLLTLPTE